MKLGVIKYFCVSKVILIKRFSYNKRLHSLKLYVFVLLGLVLVLVACNPTKDKWMNRNWHTMTGRFNVYFNGEVKYIETLQALEAGHQDDFTKVLDVFPYGDEAASKGVAGQLDVVLKKVSLAIQNHYVGRYTDNSYLLMGKAHYLKRDYYAAMEAFQYINSRYKDKGLRPVSTAWLSKCYTGLGKVDEAEAVMGLLLSEEKAKVKKQSLYHKVFPETPKEYTQEIYATAADIAIKQRKFVSATDYLKTALNFTTKKKDKIRYTYILAQLYVEQDSAKIANEYYTKVLHMLAPYEFEFNAGINLAQAYDVTDKKAAKNIRKSLKRMLKDEKNEGNYDQIWYALGNLEMKEKNTQAAIIDYKKCSEAQGRNSNQKALAYLALGNIYLEMPDYKLAQAYYDSTASTISKSNKDYDKIIAKKTVLSDLISNLIVIETEDSLQDLAKLSEAELDQKIDQWIARAKLDSAENVKQQKAQKEAEKNAKANPQQMAGIANANTKGFGEQGQWYFYNPTIMISGASEFFSQKKWGPRANEDFWRIAAMEKPKTDLVNEGGETAKKLDDNKQQQDGAVVESNDSSTTENVIPSISGSRKEWIANVPFTQEQQRQSNRMLTEAYYNMGLIYADKLNDTKEAIKNLELLLYRFPGSDYEPEVLYKLYKLYKTIPNEEQAAIKKNRLINEYPESPYALIVQDKSVKLAESDANHEVVLAYEALYAEYEIGNYEKVKAGKLEADKKYAGNTLQPKFDLLYALAVGKSEPVANFKVQLTEVVTRYPKTDVSERAQGILDYIKRSEMDQLPDSLKPKEAEFVIDENGPFYVVLAIRDDKLDMNELVAKTMSYNDEFHQFENLKVNPMLSNEGYQLLMVRDFKELAKAMAFYSDAKARDAVKKRLKYEGSYMLFVISQANFKKMLKEQKVDVYNTYFSEYEKSKQKKQ